MSVLSNEVPVDFSLSQNILKYPKKRMLLVKTTYRYTSVTQINTHLPAHVLKQKRNSSASN